MAIKPPGSNKQDPSPSKPPETTPPGKDKTDDSGRPPGYTQEQWNEMKNSSDPQIQLALAEFQRQSTANHSNYLAGEAANRAEEAALLKQFSDPGGSLEI